MTTLDADAGSKNQAAKAEIVQAVSVEQSTGTPALITQQQVLFSSAAVLTPAKPHRLGHAVHQFTASVRAAFTRPEKPRVQRHYPQRYAYFENAAMSRAMDRL
jgi:hypothetical protein